MIIIKTYKNSGFALLGTLVGTLILSTMIMGMLHISAYNQLTRVAELDKNQSYYTNIAAIEYALRQARVDGNPNPIPSRDFSGEPFVFSNSSSGCSNMLNINTSKRTAKSAFKVKKSEATVPSCLSSSVSTVSWGSNKKLLSNFYISLDAGNCPSGFYITGAKVSWTPDGGEMIKKIRIEGAPHEYDNGQPDLPSGATAMFGNTYYVNNSNNILINQLEFNTKMDVIDPTVTIEWLLSSGGCGSIPPINVP